MTLDKLFRPKSIAILGASSHKGKVGYELVYNLVDKGFEGKIYPINPKGGEVLGLKIYKSLDEVDEPIDLALVALPSSMIIDTIKKLGEKDVGAAVVYAAGFSEIGNVELEEKLYRLIKDYGIRVIGPNCAGIIYYGHRLYGAFVPGLRDGDLALLSQSGAMTAVITEYLYSKSLGLHLLVSYGNKIDVSDEEIISYFKDDRSILAYMLYVEGFKAGEGRRFYEVVKSIDKPIVMLKGGRGSVGARAAKSHTGVLAGSYQVYQAAMKQMGVYLVDEFYELVDVAEGLAYLPIPNGDKVAVVTNSGGPGVVLTDKLEDRGIPLEVTPKNIKGKLSFLPDFMGRENPIDLTANGNEDLYYHVLKILLKEDWPDIVIALHVPPSFVDPIAISKAIRDAYIDSKSDKPLIPLVFGDKRWDAYKIFWGEPRLPTPYSHTSTSKVVDALLLRRIKSLRR